MREYELIVYVKERDQPNAFMLPIRDEDLEQKLSSLSLRTLRVEVRVYGKWLKENGLHQVEKWLNNASAYKKVFNLLRQTLRLDENVRTRRLKLSTLNGSKLSLNKVDKGYLRHHMQGNSVRNHPNFVAMPKNQCSKRYSDLRKRIFEETEGIDLNLPYSIQSRLSSTVAALLVFPGEFEPPEDLAGYLFSRVSAKQVIEMLDELVEQSLWSGPIGAPKKKPKYTKYRGPNQEQIAVI